MPDLTFNQFPISGKIVDFDTLQNDVNNLNANAVLESRTINGYDLSENRTIYAQDIPSKNLLPSATATQTINGVTFTLNSDGSISTGGTAGTGGAVLFLVGSNWVGVSPYPLDKTKSYVLSGCPSGGSNSTYRISIFEYYNNGASNVNYSDTGSGVEFTPYSTATSWLVCINIQPGAGDMTGKTFYPMIRLSTAPAGYVPYAKTNVELTNPTMSAGDVTRNTTNVTGDPTRKRWFKVNNLVIASLEFTPLSGKIANGNEICSGLPIPRYDSYMGFFDCGNGRQVRVNSSGYLQYYFPTNATDTSRVDMTFVYFTT